jgi:hypothetical protein
MQPDFDLRLRTVTRALSEVIIPALDQGNRAAQEQAQVVLGSIELLRQQLEYAHWYEVADLVSLCNLAADLKAVPGLEATAELSTLQERGAKLARRNDVTLRELRNASSALRDVISEVVESVFAFQQVEVLKAVQALALAHAREQLGRERAFVAGTKWDGYPESLQGIEAALRGSESLRTLSQGASAPAQDNWSQCTTL